MFHLVLTTTKWAEQVGYLCLYTRKSGRELTHIRVVQRVAEESQACRPPASQAFPTILGVGKLPGTGWVLSTWIQYINGFVLEYELIYICVKPLLSWLKTHDFFGLWPVLLSHIEKECGSEYQEPAHTLLTRALTSTLFSLTTDTSMEFGTGTRIWEPSQYSGIAYLALRRLFPKKRW